MTPEVILALAFIFFGGLSIMNSILWIPLFHKLGIPIFISKKTSNASNIEDIISSKNHLEIKIKKIKDDYLFKEEYIFSTRFRFYGSFGVIKYNPATCNYRVIGFLPIQFIPIIILIALFISLKFIFNISSYF